MTAASTGRALLVGIGHPARGDDGVGPVVVQRAVETWEHPAESVRVEVLADPTDLLELWEGCTLVVLVDGARSGATPGLVHRFEVTAGSSDARVPGWRTPASSHGLGVADVVDLGRTLDRLPDRLVVIAVEVSELDHGDRLSTPVAGAVEQAAREVLDALGECRAP